MKHADETKAATNKRPRAAHAYWVAGRDPSPPPVQWLVNGVVPLGGVITLVGAPGSGKSAVMAALGVAVASGGLWLGLPTSRGVTVFVSFEAATSTRRRLSAELAGTAESPRVVSLAPDFNLLDAVAEDELRDMLRDVEKDCGAAPTLLIVDSLQSATRGGDENSSKDIGRAFGVLQRLACAFDLTVLVICHNGKDGGRDARGTSFILGDVDAQLFLSPDNGGGSIEVTKLRDGEPRKPVNFKLVSATDDLVRAVAADGPRQDSNPVSPDQGALLGLILAAGGAMPVKQWEAGMDAALLSVKARPAKALKQARYGGRKKLIETGRISIKNGSVSVSTRSATVDYDPFIFNRDWPEPNTTSGRVSSVSKGQNFQNSDAEGGSADASAETPSPFRGRAAGDLTLGMDQRASGSEMVFADAAGQRPRPPASKMARDIGMVILRSAGGEMRADEFRMAIAGRLIAADLSDPADAGAEADIIVETLQQRAKLAVVYDLDGQLVRLRQQLGEARP